MLRKNEKKKPSGALRHRLPHHNRLEFLFGLLVNRVLHLHVWDYSALPLNIMGQICLPFSLIWFVLTIPAIALCKLCCRLSAFPKETKSASVITDP